MTIPKGYYLMMGDNRGISDDSRDWGLEPRDGIIGVARARYWPIRRIGLPSRLFPRIVGRRPM